MEYTSWSFEGYCYGRFSRIGFSNLEGEPVYFAFIILDALYDFIKTYFRYAAGLQNIFARYFEPALDVL